MDQEALGRRIYFVRKEQHMTSEKLSDLCDVNAVFIRQIERGLRLPSVPVLVKICNALEVSANYLLGKDLKYNENINLKELADLIHLSSPKQIQLIAEIYRVVIEVMAEDEYERKGSNL